MISNAVKQEVYGGTRVHVVVPAEGFSSSVSDTLPDEAAKISADKLAFNLSRLNDIAELEEDWNGYGAAPISHFVISEATRMIFDLNEQPDAIFPTGRKSVQFEYHLPDNSYLEFEIFDERVVAMQVTGTDYDNAQFWEFSHEDTGLARKIVDDLLVKSANFICELCEEDF